MEDRGNVDFIELNGPFKCTRADAWLGAGYYFWDTFIDNAHFWGDKAYLQNGKYYIIALSKIELPGSKALNLLAPGDLLRFKSWIDSYKRSYPESVATTSRVIRYIEERCGGKLPFQAIIADFKDSIIDKRFSNRINPTINYNKAYLDLQPAIQICLKNKSVVGENNFKVVYPEEYNTACEFRVPDFV